MKYFITIIIAMLIGSAIEANTINSQYAFIENKGQIIDQNNNLNPAVKFLWTGNGMKVQLKGNSFSYEVLKYEKQARKRALPTSVLRDKRWGNLMDSMVLYSHRIDVELLNANPNPLLKAEGQSEDYLNYYTTGTPEAGVTYAHQYQKVTYKDIYPNIDLEFVLDGKSDNGFKYNFIVRPGGKIEDIKLKYVGANQVKLNDEGNLQIETNYGKLYESIPFSFEKETNKNIKVKYKEISENIFGLTSQEYNLQNTLLVDPWITYYGGGNQEGCWSIKTDINNNVFISGCTGSINNIATIGAHQTAIGGGGDGFIAKFNSNGQVLWSTYYGGSNDECIYSSELDKYGSIVVSGQTTSQNNIASVGSYQTSLSGNLDAFIAKFDSMGFRQWGTYYGGNNGASSRSITTDSTGNIFVTGFTSSTTGMATSGAHQISLGGADDAFIVKFDGNGTRQWATYFGGSNDDDGYCIATDKVGNVLLAGRTNSTNSIATSGAHQTTLGSIFISKFNSAGIRQWGTYYGEPGLSEVYDIKADKFQNVIFCGETGSPTGIATSGSYKATLSIGGSNDGYFVKFDSTGVRIWGTYYGGIGAENIASLVIDSSDNIFISGTTESTSDIATTGAFQTSLNGQSDAYFAKFNTHGVRQFASYFGGNGEDGAYIAIDNHKNIFLGGNTSSTNIATNGAYQTVYGGLYDAFIASFDSTGHITSVPTFNNPTKNSLLQVYPNPAKEQITVSIKDYTNQAATLSIQDVGGKLLQTQAVHSSINTLHLKDLPAGVYLLQYDDGEVCETLKVEKE